MLPPQRAASMAEPATAIVAPMEMSWPPVAAVTSVMPMARMASSEPLFRMEISWPERTGLPVLSWPMEMAKNDGSAMRLNTTSARSAAIGMIIWL